jgi:acetyl esterase/lipase
MDAVGALKWIENESIRCGDGSHEISLVIWGQSIGAGVASNLATKQQLFAGKFPLNLLILETPFISVRAMLETLYPQKWLPYRYLGPFLRNHLDSLTALELMSQRYGDAGIDPPQVLILEAGKDELVPKLHGDALEAVCRKVQIDVRRRVISNALHTEVIVRPEGRVALVQAIVDVSKGRKPD